MIKNIFFKELKYNLHNSKILIIWGVLLLIFILSAVSSFVHISNANRGFDLIEQKSNEKIRYDDKAGFLDELIAKSLNEPYERKNSLDMLVFTKQNLVKRASLLSFISGTDANIPDGSNMQYFLAPSIETNASSNIYLNSLYSLDWSKICIFLLSFVIICFSFDAFSREKEQGTLKLILVNGISRFSIVIGKYLGLLITFLIPLLLSLVTIIIIVVVSTSMEFLPGDIVKLLIFLFVCTIFLSINIFLGFTISCLSRISAVSLSTSLIVWTILAIIFPSTSWLGINKIKPIPTIAEVNDKIKTMHNSLEDCFLEWRYDWIGKEPSNGVLQRKDCYDRRTKIETDTWRNYYNRLFSQTEAAIKIASISPYSSFQFLCDKLTDNGYYGYNNFYKQVLNYQKQFKKFIEDKDRENKESHHLIWNESYFTCYFMSNQKVNADEMPMFMYKPTLIKEVLESSAWNIFYLSSCMIFLFACTCIAFFRYDVR